MPDNKMTTPADPPTTLPKAVSPATSGQLTVAARTTAPADPVPARRSWWVWAALVALALVAGALWYFQPWVTKGLAVAVEIVTPGPLARVLAVNGRVAPLHEVAVKATVGGTLRTVVAQEGDVVAQGDLLATVDPVQQQAAVRQALAGLDAGLVAQGQADASFARAEALGDNITRTALVDARAARQTAVQEVARLTALFDQAQIELTKFTLVAPLAGTILTRDAELGQTVDTMTALFTIADLAQLVVETDVDESHAAQISVGLPVVLRLKGGTENLDGKISFVASQVDAATGGLAVKISFDVPLTAPVGLTATANIIVDRAASAISVPRAAVVTDAAGSVVYVALAAKAQRRKIGVVDWPAERLQVTNGLASGEAVIVDAIGLSDGLAITLPGP
jgi:RND family efflux transporter MFP subunit